VVIGLWHTSSISRNMAYEQKDRWRLTDVGVPFQCVLWWMIKLGAALLLVGGLVVVIVQGVIALPSLVVPKVEPGNPHDAQRHFERAFQRRYRQDQAALSPPNPQILVPSRNFDAPQPQNLIIQPSQPMRGNLQVQAWSQPAPPSMATPRPPEGQEFSVFCDKAQQITTQWGTHRIWIHDYGSETIAFSIDGRQAVRIKKANGSDVAGDNRVLIYHDDQLSLFHVNSPRAPLDCSLIIAFPVSRL
jgi:hypothetical protein